jgi:hypothetical protein
VIHRQAQTPEYWSAYQFTQDDADFLSNYLLETGIPMPAHELVALIIRHRVEKETAFMRRDLERRTIYQPKKKFNIGEELIFPALEFASGRVVEQRPGRNPEKGPFDVVLVEMANGSRREFASNYQWPHRLNDENPLVTLSDDGASLSPEQLAEQYGSRLAEAIDAGMQKNPEFLRIANEWFLRALMAEVNIGHLNLAEAVLDMMGGGPLTADAILGELGLPPEIASSIQEISLNTAMSRDERFDDVSLNETPSWFLRRLEPPEVRQKPATLRPASYIGDSNIGPELQALVLQLDDELTRDMNAPLEPLQSAGLELTWPHRRAGTLGWSAKVAAMLPQIQKPRVPIMVRDRVTGKQFIAWMVKDGLYIYGFGDWYKANDVPAGAYIELSRGPADNIVLIDYKRRRPKREWVRVASNRDNRLRLDTAQRAVGCEFDDFMSVFVDDANAIDNLRGDRPRDVATAVREAFPEIAKLNPQGNVHARTLYAVVNVITRASPLDVFAALSASGAYTPVGDNYWHLSEPR